MIKIKTSRDKDPYDVYSPVHYWYTVHAKNGKVLVTSETFNSKQGCMKGIRSLVNMISDGNYKIIDETKK